MAGKGYADKAHDFNLDGIFRNHTRNRAPHKRFTINAIWNSPGTCLIRQAFGSVMLTRHHSVGIAPFTLTALRKRRRDDHIRISIVAHMEIRRLICGGICPDAVFGNHRSNHFGRQPENTSQRLSAAARRWQPPQGPIPTADVARPIASPRPTSWSLVNPGRRRR
jgi:hypothetical protein